MAEAAEEGEYSDETVVDSEEGEAGGEVEMEEEDATPATPSCRKSYNKTHIEGPNGMVLDVVVGDLFKAPDTVSLAHCISQDCKMSKGIAKIFRYNYSIQYTVQYACTYVRIFLKYQGTFFVFPGRSSDASASWRSPGRKWETWPC